MDLTPQERRRVRALQVWLHAEKTCSVCGVSKPVQAFTGYGEPACARCVLWNGCPEDDRMGASTNKVDPARLQPPGSWSPGRTFPVTLSDTSTSDLARAFGVAL